MNWAFVMCGEQKAVSQKIAMEKPADKIIKKDFVSADHHVEVFYAKYRETIFQWSLFLVLYSELFFCKALFLQSCQSSLTTVPVK